MAIEAATSQVGGVEIQDIKTKAQNITEKLSTSVTVEDVNEIAKIVKESGVSIFKEVGALGQLQDSLPALLQSEDSGLKSSAEEAVIAVLESLGSSGAKDNAEAFAKIVSSAGESTASASCVDIVQKLFASSEAASKDGALFVFKYLSEASADLDSQLIALWPNVVAALKVNDAASEAAKSFFTRLAGKGETSLIVKAVNESGVESFQKLGVMDAIKAAAASKEADDRANAAKSYQALCEQGDKWIEPYLLTSFDLLFSLMGDKVKAVREAAVAAGRSFVAILCPFGVKIFLKTLFQGLKPEQAWQCKEGSLTLIGDVANNFAAQMRENMGDVVLELINVISDTKKQVKTAAREIFMTVAGVIDNTDIQGIIAPLITAYEKPVTDTIPALDKLLSCTFVNTVDSQTLGFIMPLLLRGFAERKQVIKRRSAVVVDSMCKLVEDPRDALHAYPILEPVLLKCIDEIPIAEIEQVCNRSLNTLKRVMQEAIEKNQRMKTAEEVSKILKATITQNAEGANEEMMTNLSSVTDYVSSLINELVQRENTNADDWSMSIIPYFGSIVSKEEASKISESIINQCKLEAIAEEDDDEEDLCNCEFSLAYGSRVLLHQTPFIVKVGKKYGLVGPNGAGKSTLMRSIANGSLQEFPADLKTVYVEHEIQGSDADTPVVEFIQADPKCAHKSLEQIVAQLDEVGFSDDMKKAPISSLSGGWRMKLALSRAMLTDPDMLLLDEPTNHLDVNAVAWITKYIQDLTRVTCLIVSHDTKFLDDVCTDVMHYEKNLKLKTYKGNLTDFVNQVPEAKVYYELSADEESKFVFPEPGYLEGVKSTTKSILSMRNVSFQYPTAPKPQLDKVNVQCSLASRVAVVGPNGAGKSTLIKLMVGELEAQEGADYYKHPNLRIAYVAQHAFHHVEMHMEKSPVEYIMWRFAGGVDKEQAAKETLKVDEEEEKRIREEAKAAKRGTVEEIVGRRSGKREYEYEVKWEGGIIPNSYVGRNELEAMGYSKMVQAYDEEMAMQAMQGGKKLTQGDIEKHLGNFGLEPEHATHGKIGALSGGQKVKVVLGAAMWNNPHLLILDEPTNFLDRDSLGGLAIAIKEFAGGVLMITHSREFYEALCPERWFLNDGKVTVEGAEWMKAVEEARRRKEREAAKKCPVQKEEKFDSMGNTIEEKKKATDLDRKQRKQLEKKRKQMIKNGEDTFEIDELLGLV
jgi:elongation factor 3